jgi:N-acetylmuramoyl-L-alanine amidase
MSINISLKYSPNFSLKKRKEKQIKFVILHYTGMRSEKSAIKRLTEIQSEVSAHYFIQKNGKIISMVPESYIAWHAGKSSWKNFSSLNNNSIGIEISNSGHFFRYTNFSKKQMYNLTKLLKFLIHKYRIKKNCILGHSDISPERKLDPGEKFPWEKLAKKNIGFWHNLDNRRLIKLRKKKCEKVMEKQFLKNLIKIGYAKYTKKNVRKIFFDSFIIKAFQRRFRQDLVNGKIDQECLLISNNLVKLKF